MIFELESKKIFLERKDAEFLENYGFEFEECHKSDGSILFKRIITGKVRFDDLTELKNFLNKIKCLNDFKYISIENNKITIHYFSKYY